MASYLNFNKNQTTNTNIYNNVENQQRNTDNGIIAGAVSLTLSVIIVKILGYVYKLPLSFLLGDDGMGYFNTAYTIFAFFYMLASGGIPRAVSIIICELREKESEGAGKSAFSVMLRFFFLFGLGCSALLFVFSGALVFWVGNTKAYYSVLCIAPSLLFVAVGGFDKTSFISCCFSLNIS